MHEKPEGEPEAPQPVEETPASEPAKPSRKPGGVALVELHERVATLEKRVLDTPEPENELDDKSDAGWWW